MLLKTKKHDPWCEFVSESLLLLPLLLKCVCEGEAEVGMDSLWGLHTGTAASDKPTSPRTGEKRGLGPVMSAPGHVAL